MARGGGGAAGPVITEEVVAMPQAARTRAFTLVEMLVVVGIIAVLTAILYPVFSSARIKARQTKCIGQLQQLIVTLKTYVEDYRAYPPPPMYDATSKRFWGGFSSLWPDYISSADLLICPDDRAAKTARKKAIDLVYSSYNADIDLATWDENTTVPLLDKRLYNYFGYDSNGYDVYDWTNYIGPEHGFSLPWWLREKGLSWRHYPRLMNRYAPDNTIVTHCVKHRHHWKQANWRDIVARLGGDIKVVPVSQMSATITGPSGQTATAWEHQRY